MAHIHPTGWENFTATGAAGRRLDTLRQWAATLPDAYTVYHGMHWSQSGAGSQLPGGVDFVLVNPAGALLLVEQKAGLLEETPEGLMIPRGLGERRLTVRLAQALDIWRGRLASVLAPMPPVLDALYYCPDYTVKTPATAGLDPAHIVDASRRDQLAARIRALLPEAAPVTAQADAVHRFMREELDLVPDANALVGESRVLYTRLSGGLAHWAQRLDFQPFRLRVVGTAGSGKTQLALAVMAAARAAGRRVLYVCYNRPLADHVARLAGEGARVVTYHQLADQMARAHGQSPDFSRPDAFRSLADFLTGYQPEPAERFDELIVDEGQDFQPDWRDALLRLLHPTGRAWWLEDPMQNLYGREPVDLPGWVTLTADTNYRSPRDVLAFFNRLAGAGPRLEAGSPVVGKGVDRLVYDTPDELLERTKTAITRALGAGYRRDMIVLLTFRGREKSRLTGLERLGPHTLRSFTGRYDLFGNPEYTPGELRLESLHRFKGQAAPCVILTEVEFDCLDEPVLRKLFVGMTRATLKLVMVLSARAAREIEDYL